MRPRTLLILLALVLGLGAFIWFYERDLPSSEERGENAKKVLPFEKDDIRKVTIQGPSGRVVLERVGEKGKEKEDEKNGKDGEEESEELEPQAEWRIAQPMQARADTFAVDGLLDSLASLERSRTLEDVDPKATGLEKPRATVRLETRDGEKLLKLGAAVPTGGELIAGIEGEKDASVVSDSIFSQLDREPGSWRDKQLFRASRDEIARIALFSGGRRVVLAQQGERFRIEAPLRDRADRERTDDLYADLSGLMAESFVDAPRPPAELGLAPPRAVVEVAFRKRQPVRIELGAPVAADEAPEPATSPDMPPPAAVVYARIGSQVFETRTKLADAASRPPADWRARSLSSFEVHEIESATIKDAQGTLRLTRAGTDWKRGNDTISYISVSDLLFAVADAKADRLLVPAELSALGPLGNPAVTIDLDAKTAGKESITLYPAVAAGVPARVAGRDVVVLLPADKLKDVQSRIDDVRKAGVMKGE